MQDLTDGAKGLTIDEDTDKTEKERMDIFYNKVFNFVFYLYMPYQWYKTFLF